MELLPLVCLCLLSCSGDAVKVVVEEDRDAVLPCLISNKDLTGNKFDWKKDGLKDVFMYDKNDKFANRGQDEQFIGRVLHFQDQLQNGNASIKITRTKMVDMGTYSCIHFPDLQKPEISETFNIELVVGQVLRDRTGEKPGASKPSVTIIKTDDVRVLQCEVFGASPKPKVEWKDSSGNILPVKDLKETENGGSYDIVLQAALTKMDKFRCVVTQEEISHQSYAEIDLDFNGGVSKPSVKTIQTDEGMMLLCEVLGVSPKPKVEWKDSSGNVLPVKDLKEIERGGSYDIILQAALTKTDNFSCVVTQEGSYSPLSAEIYAVAGSNTGAIVGGVVGVAALIIIVLVAVIIILCRKLRNPGSTPVAAKGQPDANEGTKMIASE